MSGRQGNLNRSKWLENVSDLVTMAIFFVEFDMSWLLSDNGCWIELLTITDHLGGNRSFSGGVQ